MKMRLILITMAMVVMVCADIYLHNPRGSNNRQDENGRERRNANRMFDSQNNNRGGYNKGDFMYYYTGSILPIEWTNQHECGGEKTNCNIIIQYMCSPHIRDGKTTNTIPEHHQQCQNRDCNTDDRFGLHESNEYYQDCKHTQYNRGLFRADQNLNFYSAQYTRQNPGGTRRGYECPEERDYYPYWRPSPWRDIVIFTDDTKQCEYFLANSENQKGKQQCFHKKLLEKIRDRKSNPNTKYPKLPIKKVECERFEYEGEYGQWVDTPPHNIALPECLKSPLSRDNHNGNGLDGKANVYNWKIPEYPCEHAVVRIRYNISTGDYKPNVNFDSNGKPAKIINIGDLVGLSNPEAHERGYVFQNDPQVQPLKGPHGSRMKLAIALNTAQTGRTFQDRSHRFAIRDSSATRDCKKTYNLNVRGKRGNIVQVYPAVEYDFVPNTIHATTADCVHIQWTGSNNNPQNNDGEGTRGTDRSNIIALRGPAFNKDADFRQSGVLGNSYPEHLDNTTFLGLSRSESSILAILKDVKEGEPKVDGQLNNAKPYFDGGLFKFTKPGTHNYLCTRNNNFSNRSQKGRIIVTEANEKRKDFCKRKDTPRMKKKYSDSKKSYHREIDHMMSNYAESNVLRK